jgi:rhodanese-related sulfurtransferase
MVLIPLKPTVVAERLNAGAAVLVDIREPEEFAPRHIDGALSRPLSSFDPDRLGLDAGRQVIFTCRTGMRTGANCDRLRAAIPGEAYVLEGGLDAWAAAGLPVQGRQGAV